MKSLLALLVLIFSLTAFAFPIGYGTSEIYSLKTALGTVVDQGVEGLSMSKKAIITYDATVDASISGAATGLSVTLPASVIQNVAIKWETVPVSASSNTIAIHCETANDLLSAADLTGGSTTALLTGVPQLSDNTTSLVSDGCTPTVTIGTGTTGITAGKGYIIIDYVELP